MSAALVLSGTVLERNVRRYVQDDTNRFGKQHDQAQPVCMAIIKVNPLVPVDLPAACVQKHLFGSATQLAMQERKGSPLWLRLL
jgi:hypothetical protein